MESSKRKKIPYSTIQEAITGDITAIKKITKNYDGYIKKLSTKKLLMNMEIVSNSLMKLCIANYKQS